MNKSLTSLRQRSIANVAAWSQLLTMEGLLSVAVLMGVGLRSLWLGKRELWYDESISVLLASGQKSAYQLADNTPFPLQDISSILSIPAEESITATLETFKGVINGTLSDPHPPLFYLGVHVWMRLFGNGEAALRSLMVTVSLVTLLLAYVVGKRVLGRRGGLIFTALFSLNPFFLVHSLNLRMYALMVLWVMAGAGSFFALVGLKRERNSLVVEPINGRSRWLLSGVMTLSLTAGLMTQYLFTYWLFALAGLVLYLDRKRWLQTGLSMGAGVLLFLPWVSWGVRQQVNNRSDVLSQISAVGGPMQAMVAHGKDLAQTLANHLLIGHLATGMLPMGEAIKPTAVAIGCGVIGFLCVCMIGLYRRRQYKVLVLCVMMGLGPLATALCIDIAVNKYTVGFGWGRSTIVALPGCLLLIAAWLELATGRWRRLMTAGLLAVYLAVNVGDFAGRDRQMFHLMNTYLPASEQSALVVMNSRAWGHVLRLAYYLQTSPAVEVLVCDSDEVAPALETALANKAYSKVLWVDLAYPLWSAPETAAEESSYEKGTAAALLSANYERDEETDGPIALSGTMNLDQLTLRLYTPEV